MLTLVIIIVVVVVVKDIPHRKSDRCAFVVATAYICMHNRVEVAVGHAGSVDGIDERLFSLQGRLI